MSSNNRYVGVGQFSTRKEVYHSDPDCRFAGEELRTVSDEEIEYHDMRLCKWCDPDVTPNADHGNDKSLYQTLVAMGEENADV